MAASCPSSSELASKLGEKLPGLDDGTMTELCLCLRQLGVSTMEDLEFVKPERLTPPLTEVQARKLLKAYSGDVADREQYNLKQKEQDIKFLEVQKGLEIAKMKYKQDMETKRMEVQRAIADQNNEIQKRAENDVDKEDTRLVLGSSSYGAGFGAVVGMIGGPLGMAAGAAIGAAVSGGISGVITSETRGKKMEEKKAIYSSQAAERRERLKVMEKDLERNSSECKLGDVNKAMIDYKRS